LCFFIDSNCINEINFPDKFEYSHDREIVTFNREKIFIRPKDMIYNHDINIKFGPISSKETREYISIVSTSCWYSNSMVFNIISKYFKGNQFNNHSKKWKSLLNNIFSDGEYPRFINETLTFHTYIRRIGFTFLYVSEK